MIKELFDKFMNAFSHYAPIESYDKYPITDPKYAIKNLKSYYSDIYTQMIWDDACESVGISGKKLNPEELLKLYAYLAKQPDLVGVVGRSLFVKLKTYIKLSEKTAAKQTA